VVWPSDDTVAKIVDEQVPRPAGEKLRASEKRPAVASQTGHEPAGALVCAACRASLPGLRKGWAFSRTRHARKVLMLYACSPARHQHRHTARAGRTSGLSHRRAGLLRRGEVSPSTTTMAAQMRTNTPGGRLSKPGAAWKRS
jgi:hypothetical protein